LIKIPEFGTPAYTEYFYNTKGAPGYVEGSITKVVVNPVSGIVSIVNKETGQTVAETGKVTTTTPYQVLSQNENQVVVSSYSGENKVITPQEWGEISGLHGQNQVDALVAKGILPQGTIFAFKDSQKATSEGNIILPQSVKGAGDKDLQISARDLQDLSNINDPEAKFNKQKELGLMDSNLVYLGYDKATGEYKYTTQEKINREKALESISGDYKTEDGKSIYVEKYLRDGKDASVLKTALGENADKIISEAELAINENLAKMQNDYTSQKQNEMISNVSSVGTPKNWQDIRTGEFLSNEERNARLKENPNAPIVRHIPEIRDVVVESLSLGKVQTATFNKDDIEKQYDQQKDIAEAVFRNDKAKIDELYKQGAFGEDTTIQTWRYYDSVNGWREINAEERKEILSKNPSAYDRMANGNGIKEPPKSYAEALKMIDQQKDIEKAVSSGDLKELERLHDSGAFGDPFVDGSRIDNYNNLVEYVKQGGRELSKPTQEDIDTVRNSFGTKDEYVKNVLEAQPSAFDLAKDVGIAMIPVYGTIKTWDSMSGTWKAGSIALDALTFVPFVGGLSAAAKVSAGVGRTARLIAATKAIPEIAISEFKAPYTALRHPLNTAKESALEIRKVGEWLLNPKAVPLDSLTTTYGTVRLDASVVGSPEAAMYVRDELMRLQAAGQKPVVTFGDKVYTLREPSFMQGGGLVTASPDIKWVDVEGGATVLSKVYPEGHPKAGQRMPDSEQGLFTANVGLERFTTSSAFGLEKFGAKTLDEKIKVIAEVSQNAKTIGDVKLSQKLDNIIANVDVAKKVNDQAKLEQITTKIDKELSGIELQQKFDEIYRLKVDASEKYRIGDVAGSQKSMADAIAIEDGMRAKKPGIAIFSPEVSVNAVPSGKLYEGMVFQPKLGEIWQIAMADVKQDKAAQLFLKADEAKKAGDVGLAERLSDEANDLVRSGNTGFRRVSTTEMELKFPEYFNLPEMKERYSTFGDKGRLSIFTDKPYDFIKVVKAKALAPIETIRQIYSPAISAKNIPLTDAERVDKINLLLKEANELDVIGDTAKANIKRLEADSLKGSAKGIIDLDSAVKTSKVVDDVDEYTLAAQKAESLGDYVSADRLAREAESIRADRLARDASLERAGTQSGIFGDSRILGYRPQDIANASDVRVTRRDIREVETPARSDLFDLSAPNASDFSFGMFDERKAEVRDGESRGLFDFGSSDRINEVRESDSRQPESRVIDSRVVDERQPEVREPDNAIARDGGRELTTDTPELRGLEVREPDVRVPDVRPPEIREPETRLPDDRIPEQRIPEGRTPDVRIPQIESPKPEPPKKLPKMSVYQKEEFDRISKLNGVITWRQGAKWQVLPPPYGQEDMRYFDQPIPGTYKFATGKGSAYKTIQVIGGAPKQDVDVDLGWTQIHISAKGKDLQMSFGGGKEAADERWSQEEQAMSELERQSYSELPQGEISERIPRGSRPRSQGLNKVLLPEYSTEDLKVYSINGNYIRNRFGDKIIGVDSQGGERLGIDFVSGGHEFVYPDLVPKGEVWIEENLDNTEKQAVILHELKERQDMGGGMEYGEAHDRASEVEIDARQSQDTVLREIEEYQKNQPQRVSLNNTIFDNGNEFEPEVKSKYTPVKKDMRLRENRQQLRQQQNVGYLSSRKYFNRTLRPSSLGGI